MPLTLTPRQRKVLEALQDKETKENPISKWYLGALYALDNQYNPDRISQAAQSLRELLEKLLRVILEGDAQHRVFDFVGMRRNINARILNDKKHYDEGWNGKKIDGHLDETLKQVERYFTLNQQPTRKEQIQKMATSTDPMAGQLGEPIREKKQNRFHNLWKGLEGFAHHRSNPDIEEFRKHLETLEEIVLDLLAPITAQDQHEIQSILKRSEKSEPDVKIMLSLIERKGANFAFFFQHADASWIPILRDMDYFTHPPDAEPMGDGRVNFPLWWPIRYLARMSKHAPDEVVELVSRLPKVNNIRIYDDILDIALRLRGEQSVKLKKKILEYAGMEYRFSNFKYVYLLAHWTKENQTSAALELSKMLVKFDPDPQSEHKQAQQKEDPDDHWTHQLHPSPRFDELDYEEIMKEGIRPLAEKEPYKVALILIDATAQMIRLQTHQDDLDKGKEEDFSEMWCPRLDESGNDYRESRRTLVLTLTFACEKVFEKSPDLVAKLDEKLRKQPWVVFKRLRQHLYTRFPHATCFQELEAEASDPISDETYSPITCRVGMVSSQSPKSLEDLESLTDENLLAYINEWQKEHHDKDNWLIEITISALSKSFQTVFKNSIIPDADRLRFWMENRKRIERPIYVLVMIRAMQECVQTKNFDKISEWLTFCEWVLSHPDQEREEGVILSDESRENPSWHSSRRAVGDFIENFIEICIEEHEEHVDVPVSTPGQLATLLETLCTQFDWHLDRNKPVFPDQHCQITEAINNTRSRALKSLVYFGFWLQKYDPKADTTTVTTILEKRFGPETEHPLTLPERAILGMNYGLIVSLSEAWATEHKSDFFPQDELPAWLETFKGFLFQNRHPSKRIYEILRDDFDFALEHLADFKEEDHSSEDVIDVLGQHLFFYYLWGAYPLEGDESLLERYYCRTKDDRKRWARLFDHMGILLRNNKEPLDVNLKNRIIKFFKWRLKDKEPMELKEFPFWLEAECLDAEWRLEAYSETLDVCISRKVRPSHYDSVLAPLREMLTGHTAKVVECFARFTDCVLKHDIYICKTNNARTILKAGLESSDEQIRKNAEYARDNLLKVGRFEFLNMEDDADAPGASTTHHEGMGDMA